MKCRSSYSPSVQAAPMALYWCTFQTLNCMAGMVRVAVTKGLWALLLELYGFGTFFPAYAGGAYFIWKAPKHSEVGANECGHFCCSPMVSAPFFRACAGGMARFILKAPKHS
eukprot:1152170-Pelagomonas_calceolata.AAC.6